MDAGGDRHPQAAPQTDSLPARGRVAARLRRRAAADRRDRTGTRTADTRSE